MVVKDVIQEKLSKKELHQLLSLCTKYYPLPLHVLEGQKEYLETTKKNAMGNNYFKKLLDIKKIHALYQKAGIIEKDYLAHWTTERTVQRIKHNEYNQISKPERKDNKTYLNRGSGFSNANPVRYPKK
jgi:hypothetical protein